MKKITILALLTLFLGLNNVNASETGCLPENYNEIMTTSDNSLIVSARSNIYSIDLTTYHATLLTSSPYVAEINSLAVDATTGWIFYVSNQASRYNWTVYGYNVYSDTHKSFGDIRSYFTSTGHANSSRGLGSGGATFYNGKLYFAMEYPSYCYSYRTSKGVVNVKDELKDHLPNNLKTSGSLENSLYDVSTKRANSLGDQDSDFVELNGADIKGEVLSDYFPEVNIKQNVEINSTTSFANNSNQKEAGRSSYYNNRIYLLEVCFNNLSDATGNSSVITTAAPKYDIYGHSSFIYKGELGDIAVSDSGEIYAVTSYQIQHFDFNSNTFCWANNENVYAQIAKDKNSALHLLKNKKQCTHSNGCYSSCTRKSYVQSYTPPAQLQTYNNIQLGSLNEITGLQASDIGKITDAADYVNTTVATSYKVEGNIFNDQNENGTKDAGEGNLDNVALTLYEDTDANGMLGENDVELNTASSNVDGNYEFNNISAQNILVKVTVPDNTELFTYALTTDEVLAITSTTDVDGVDFGLNKAEVIIPTSYKVEGNIFNDQNNNGTKDAGEGNIENVALTLYEDTDANGILGDNDVELNNTSSSVDGNYEFNSISAENILVKVTVPENTALYTYALTTDEVLAITSTTDVDGVDFGLNKAEVVAETFNISGVVWDDNNRDGIKDVLTGEVYLEDITVNLYSDNNENGVLDASDALLASEITTANNPNYEFNNIDQGFVIVEAIKPASVFPVSFTLTFDLDSGITSADGIFATELVSSLTDVDFGIDKLFGNSRAANTPDTKKKSTLDNIELTQETEEDLAENMRLFPNPSKDFIYVENEALAGLNVNIEVIGRNGQVFIKESFKANSLGLIRVDISRLKSGLHYMSISANSEKVVKTIYKK